MTSKTKNTFELLMKAYEDIEAKTLTSGFQFKDAQAKSGKDGQTLKLHLSAVGFVAGEIVKKIIRDGDGGKDTDLGDFAKIAIAGAVLGGFFHDIGKAEDGFQNYIQGLEVKNDGSKPPHEITGLNYFNSHVKGDLFKEIISSIFGEDKTRPVEAKENRDKLLRCIRQSILWHHGRRMGDDDLGKEGWDDLFDIGKTPTFNEEIPYVYQYNSPNIVKKIDTNFTFWNKAYKNGGLENLLKWEYNDTKIDTTATSLREYFYGTHDGQSSTKGKFRTETELNALADICLKAVIAADRFVSPMTQSELTDRMINWGVSSEDAVASPLYLSLSENTDMPDDGWDVNRWKNSWKSARARKYDDQSIIVNQMMAGLGKTAWTMQHLYGSQKTSQKRTVWIAPRLPICNGVYDELKAFFEGFKLTGVVGIRTGEVKECVRFEKGVIARDQSAVDVNHIDILITTVDYYVSSNLASVRGNSLSIDFFASNLVIDEFHEFVNLENMLPVLATSVEARKHIDAKTILLSATPNPPLIKMLGLEKCLMTPEDAEFSTLAEEKKPAPLRKKISLGVNLAPDQEALKNVLCKQDGRSFLFAQNAVAASQLAFATQMVAGVTGDKSVLFHGSYARFSKGGSKSAWRMGFDKIMDTFGKNSGEAKDHVCYSAAILRASLNVSFDDMVHYTAGPDNDLQLIGRLDRFAKSATTDSTDSVPTLSILLPKKNEGNGAAVEFLYDLEVAGRWLALVAEKSSKANGPIENLAFYGWYREFYDNELKAATTVFSAYDIMSVQMLKGIANIAGGFFAPLKGRDSISEGLEAADYNSSGPQPSSIHLPLLDASGAMVWSSDDSKSRIFVSGLYQVKGNHSYNPKDSRLWAKNVANLINKTGATLSALEIAEGYRIGKYQTYKDIQNAISTYDTNKKAIIAKYDKNKKKNAAYDATTDVISDFIRSHQFYHHGKAEIDLLEFDPKEHPSKKDGLRGDSFYVAIPSISHRGEDRSYSHLSNHGIGLGLLDLKTAYEIDKEFMKGPEDFIKDQIQAKVTEFAVTAVPSRYYAPETDKAKPTTVWIPLTTKKEKLND